MKKFYETPAVEFTGFNAEDVITTSIIDATTMDAAAIETFKARVDSNVASTGVQQAINYGEYQW